MSTPFDLPALALTDADRAAWDRYERANAKCADQYEALPIAARRGGRLHICTRCRCVVPERGLCRWCRRFPHARPEGGTK